MEYRPFDYKNPVPSVPDHALDATVVMGASPEDDTAILGSFRGEVLTDEQQELDIAYHAAQMLAAERRAERPAATIDKMARKSRLHAHIGNSALGHTVTITEPDGSTPRNKTWADRFMDKRIEGKSFTAAKKEYERNRVATKVYRSEASKTLGLKSRMTTRARLSQAEQDYKDGLLSARQLRVEQGAIKGSPKKLTERERQRRGLGDDDESPNLAYENPAQKRLRKRTQSAQKSARRSARQPVASHWRSMRHRQASKQYDVLMDIADYHRSELERFDPEHPLLANDEDEEMVNPDDTPTVATPTVVDPATFTSRHDFSDLVDPPTPPDSFWAPRDDEGSEGEAWDEESDEVDGDEYYDEDDQEAVPEDSEDDDEQESVLDLRQFRQYLADKQREQSNEFEVDEPEVQVARPARPRTDAIPTTSRESVKGPVDPWEIALDYTAYVIDKRASGGSISMSPESIINRLAREGVEEEEARSIYRRMQGEGIVDSEYTPRDGDQDGGFLVRKSAAQIRDLLNN